MARTRNIDFVFFDAGGGHRAAATALKTVIEQQQRPWSIRMVNFQEVLDEIDIFRKLAGIRLQDVYNLILKKGWTLGSPLGLVLMHWIIRLYHPAQLRVLQKFWAASHPDLVVSLIPNFPRVLYQSLRSIHPHTPMVTILTDFADYPLTSGSNPVSASTSSAEPRKPAARLKPWATAATACFAPPA